MESEDIVDVVVRAEQARIAREIHDQPLQLLAGGELELLLTDTTSVPPSPTRAGRGTGATRSLAAFTAASVRRRRWPII